MSRANPAKIDGSLTPAIMSVPIQHPGRLPRLFIMSSDRDTKIASIGLTNELHKPPPTWGTTSVVRLIAGFDNLRRYPILRPQPAPRRLPGKENAPMHRWRDATGAAVASNAYAQRE